MMRHLAFMISAAVVLAAPIATAAQEEDETTEVEALIVIPTREAPFPRVGEGAPNYSVEQTASFICEATTAGQSTRVARWAHDATVAAQATRLAAGKGQANRQAMEEAELARQRAVRLMSGGADPVGASASGARRDGLVIQNVGFRVWTENDKDVIIAAGEIRNTGRQTVELPPLSFTTIDERGFVIAGQSFILGIDTLEPRQTHAFTFRIKNPPLYTRRVRVNFAPPFQVRNIRSCNFMTGSGFDPMRPAGNLQPAKAEMVPIPTVGAGAPYLTVEELATLTRRLRTAAQTAYSNGVDEARACRRNEKPRFFERWQPVMRLADLSEEAWSATMAAETVRQGAVKGYRDDPEVRAAELDRQKAVQALFAADAARRAALLDAAPLAIQKQSAVDTNDQRGPVQQMVAVWRNGSDAPLESPPIGVMVRDSRGMALSVEFVDGRAWNVIPAGGLIQTTQTIRPRPAEGTSAAVFSAPFPSNVIIAACAGR